MIEAQQLTKMFGNVRALDRVSFKVRRGEVVGFLGPNGAGKSTTMRILTCFISSTHGTARIRGIDVFDDPLEVRRCLGYLPQRAPLYGEMRAIDYLKFVAEMRGIDMGTFKKRMKQVVEVCGLAKVLGKDIRTLSHGYRQRVGLAQALIHDPPILILDEPTSDLDPNEKAEVIRYIKEIGRERTILLSTHNLREVEEACARAIIVSKGRVVADGSLEDMRARTGSVRYVVTIDEKRALTGKAPNAQQVQEGLSMIEGMSRVKELPTDESTHTFEMVGDQEVDARPDIHKMVVEKGWMMLELRRETQTLEDVFMALTRGDERGDRGRALLGDDEAEQESLDEDEDEDESEDEDEDESDDADEEEEAEEAKPQATKAAPPPPPAKAAAKPAPAAEDDEDEDEEDEDDSEDDDSDESDEASDEDESDDDDSDEDEEEDEPAKAAPAPSKSTKPGEKAGKKG
ncbi:MAG: ATP-binding cassette domain-containing protein [Polyangiaceae bacterium]